MEYIYIKQNSCSRRVCCVRHKIMDGSADNPEERDKCSFGDKMCSAQTDKAAKQKAISGVTKEIRFRTTLQCLLN